MIKSMLVNSNIALPKFIIGHGF